MDIGVFGTVVFDSSAFGTAANDFGIFSLGVFGLAFW